VKGIYPSGLKIQDFLPSSNKQFSNAEFIVYQEFEHLAESNDIFCIYSFRIEYHSRKNQGEIDFMVLAPSLGIIVLEVKGSKIKKDSEGCYHCYNRGSNSWEQIQNPFKQAEENAFSLMNILSETTRILRKKPLITWGCVFPENDTLSTGAEIPNWRYINHRDFIHNLYQCLHEISIKEKDKNKHHFDELSELDIKTIVKTLVGDPFEGNYKDLDFSVGTRHLEAITTSQYKILQDLTENDRIFFSGAAGTGKTFLAIQEFNRLNNLGKQCKIIVPNIHLKKWLLSVIGADRTDSPVYIWDEKALITDHRENKLDYLIIDEVQDAIESKKLTIVDEILKGGLTLGHWRFFGDPVRQALKSGPINLKTALAEFNIDPAAVVFYKLRINVRNTKMINHGLKKAVDLADTDLIENDYTGEKISFVIYESDDFSEKMNSQISRLLNDGHNPHRISIIIPSGLSSQPCKSFDFQYHFMETDAFTELNGITIGDEEVFKGLENDIILYVLPVTSEIATKQKVYTAMSRARLKLILLCRIDLTPRYINIIKSST
jgi:DNA replication protein DnaC